MKNNKQQTAIQWFADKIEILHYDYWAEHISKDEKNQRLRQLKEQAKEMEKERIIDAFVECWKANMPDGYECKLSAEQYYEQTYGGGNK